VSWNDVASHEDGPPLWGVATVSGGTRNRHGSFLSDVLGFGSLRSAQTVHRREEVLAPSGLDQTILHGRWPVTGGQHG
jgi:hypothetical protein